MAYTVDGTMKQTPTAVLCAVITFYGGVMEARSPIVDFEKCSVSVYTEDFYCVFLEACCNINCQDLLQCRRLRQTSLSVESASIAPKNGRSSPALNRFRSHPLIKFGI